MRINNKQYMFKSDFENYQDRFFKFKGELSEKDWEYRFHNQIKMEKSLFLKEAYSHFNSGNDKLLKRFVRRIEVSGSVYTDYFEEVSKKQEQDLIVSVTDIAILNQIIINYFLKNSQLQFLNIAFKLYDLIDQQTNIEEETRNMNRYGLRLCIQRITKND